MITRSKKLKKQKNETENITNLHNARDEALVFIKHTIK